MLDTFRSGIEEIELVTSGGGAFEVSVDGKLVHSKKKQGGFPNEDALVASLQAPVMAKG